MSPVRLRPLAEDDLIERVRYYRKVADDELAMRFFDSAMAALRAIGRMPGIGSPSVGERCGIPGLRLRPITGFPCGWFYLARRDHVDVVRLLADRQDTVAVLGDIDDE